MTIARLGLKVKVIGQNATSSGDNCSANVYMIVTRVYTSKCVDTRSPTVQLRRHVV